MDIYFEPNYCKLNEAVENGTAETFYYECEYGKAQNSFIKREIPHLINGTQYYDAITPYGYGGPIIIESSCRSKLIEAYSEAYVNFCAENRIVDEFVRFHPLAENVRDFEKLYNAEFNRYTAAIDLQDSDFYMVQFTSECRNRIKNSRKRGVSVEIDEDCKHLDDFIRLYYMTMDKNNASDYYYFDREYFNKLLDVNNCRVMLVNAYYEGEIIASVLYMISAGFMHYHLSANNPEHYKLAANNLIVYASCEYGRAHGLKWLHLGGGLSSSADDNLFRFKRGFARTDRNLKEFYIGKAVFLPSIYDRLCESAGADWRNEDGFFPAYRERH